jgi:hypothetical protein
MFKKKENLKPENKHVGMLFLFAFFLLAIGDTGHVGFRVIAVALGGFESNPVLVGMGALATAITLTFFYMILAEIWRVRFHSSRDFVWWSLIMIGIVRLFIMIPSGNQWANVVPPFDWSLARNIPLMIQGIGVGILMLLSAQKANDKLIKQVCYMIFLSYACYIPVILFVQKIPMLGMLMIPKTLAYVAIAVLAFSLFNNKNKE